MALTQKLEFRQSQALVMTPQLMQAIKLLQLSNLDLTAYVETELERNPLLERSAETESDPDGERDGAEPAGVTEPENGNGEWLGQDLEPSRSALEERLGTRLDNVFPDDGDPAPPRAGSDQPAAYSEWASVGAGGREGGEYNLEAFVSAEETLADHLAEQLSLSIAD